MLTEQELRDRRNEIDGEILRMTCDEILQLPPALRDAAVKDYEAIDPDLGARLRLTLYLAL